MPLRYVVEYVHFDGNRCEVGSSDSLQGAQVQAEAVKKELDYVRRLRLPVLITDTEDPERGDLSDVEEED
jgi:hypothetical protein